MQKVSQDNDYLERFYSVFSLIKFLPEFTIITIIS